MHLPNLRFKIYKLIWRIPSISYSILLLANPKFMFPTYTVQNKTSHTFAAGENIWNQLKLIGWL